MNKLQLQMICVLANLGSEGVSRVCQDILNSDDIQAAIEEEKKYCGDFLLAVFNSDFDHALRRADTMNRSALSHLKIMGVVILK